MRFAIAREQEMKAAVQLNRALVVEAESQVPMGLAHAFRIGNLHGKTVNNGAG